MNQQDFQEPPKHPSLKISMALILGGFILASPLAFIPQSISLLFIVLGELALIVPTIFYITHKKYNLKQVFRIHGVERNTLLLIIPLGLAIIILSDELDRIVRIFFEMPEELQEALAQQLSASGLWDWLNLFLGAVLLASIFEEVLFRGMLQQALEKTVDITRAIFLTAFFFAAVHLNPFWLIQILVLGIVFSLITWRSNSIIPTVIIHCLNNSFSLVFANTESESWQWYLWNDHVHPTIVVLAIAVLYYSAKGFIRATEE